MAIQTVVTVNSNIVISLEAFQSFVGIMPEDRMVTVISWDQVKPITMVTHDQKVTLEVMN